MKEYDVIGLSNTLMDLLVEIEDQKLIEMNLKKGTFHLVNEDKAKHLLDNLNNSNLTINKVPGGSSANTVKGISFLGGKAILCGKVGSDNHGEMYIQQIKDHGVICRVNKHEKCTGHCLTFITPDAQRTFSVHLGAAIELCKEDILEEDIKKSKILHIEGYQIEGPTKETIMHAINLAKNNECLVSIDLADPNLIKRNKNFLKELVLNHADIIFVNETEAKEFTGLENKEAARELGKFAKIAIVKLGKKGALINENGLITDISSYPVNAIDTTGAGDSFAAGFLYGYCQNWDSKRSGQLGALLASKVVEQIGVKINELNKDLFFKEFISYCN